MKLTRRAPRTTGGRGRRVPAPRAAALLLLLALGTAGGTARAGGAPSITPDMPPEVRSLRDVILAPHRYAEIADRWRAYLDAHPTSAVAHVQLARAHRYAGTAPALERQRLVRKALDLDPDCPEALDALADTALHSESPGASLTEARAYALRAAELAPAWTEPLFTLWSICGVLGRHDEADGHLESMLARGAFPAPVLDLGYNLLVSADPGAVIFTNGDNDTYPPLALQVARGTRTDVAIVNLSLLNRIEYATSVWARTFGPSGPFTEPEIRALHDRWKQSWQQQGGAPHELFSVAVTRALADKVRDGSWSHPVYFAITVAPMYFEACPQALEIEGVIWRVTRAPKSDASAEMRGVNLAKTLRLFRHDLRLDSITDLSFPWTPESAYTPLMRNYPAVLCLVASAGAGRGDLEVVRFALGEAMRMLDFHGDTEFAERTARYWKEVDPDNPEVDRWLPPE